MYSVSSNAVARALKNGIYAGTFLLWSGNTALTANQTVTVLGAYGTSLIGFVPKAPTGFHIEYVLVGQITSNDSINVRIRLNNIATNYGGTWSVDSFRIPVVANKFKISDIVLEPTYYYSQNGINLKFQTNGGSGTARVYSVSITAFYVKD